MSDPEYRYENALKWIRFTAGLHYFGGAFDPEHMRDLANLAADALAGERDLPDYDESMAGAKKRGIQKYNELKERGIFPNEEDTTNTAKIFAWDWKAQPSMDDIAAAVMEITDGQVTMRRYDTGGDTIAWVVADHEVSDDEARKLYQS